jgi:mevalonate kinase
MKLSVSGLKKLIKEEYFRGMPEFIVSDVASNCSEQMKRHLVRHINQRSKDPKQQREMLAKANKVIEELEKEIKEKIEEKLFEFLQGI